MKMNRKSFVLILALAGTLILVLSSCSLPMTTQSSTTRLQDDPAGSATIESSVPDNGADDEPMQTESEPNQTEPSTESDETSSVRELISPEQARRMLDEEEDALLLDVRTEAEYAEGHIPGTLLIPITELEERLDEIIAWQDKPVIIYCRSGNRSAQAASILEANGFQYLYDLGGIINWPYETERVE